MTKAGAVALVVLSTMAVVGVVNADSRENLVRFDGGIGSSPISAAAGPLNQDGTFQNVTRNFVRGVRSATQLWTIKELKADVTPDGQITVQGRGMVLAGGDNIGLVPNIQVVATLICEATAPFVERSSSDTTSGLFFVDGAPLEANGDFRIESTLRTPGGSNIPMPSECDTPVLLIRSAGNGAFLAAGIPKFNVR